MLVALLSACFLQFTSRHDNLSASCCPPVLPDGCDLNLLRGVTKKLLDSAKRLVTNFQLKSSESNAILLKNVIFNTIERNL